MSDSYQLSWELWVKTRSHQCHRSSEERDIIVFEGETRLGCNVTGYHEELGGQAHEQRVAPDLMGYAS